MKIDLVYLWCDGNDAAWREKKIFWQNQYGNLAHDVIGDNRFVQHDELKFSLRSVEMYMPWINHIFIVTDGQIPEWLDTDNPKISIVDHKDIMPADALPTFNSNAIEACLHNIPNLSEHFLFANDDTFVSRPLKPDFFFAEDGRPYVFLQPQNIYAECVYKHQIYYAQSLIKERFGTDYPFEPHHNIDAYRLSDIKKCADDFKVEFDCTVYQRFREAKTMQRSIWGYYALATDAGILVKNKNRKCQHPYYKKEQRGRFVSKIFSDPRNVSDSLYRNEFSLFCLNDNTKLHSNECLRIKWTLASAFPFMSSFEKNLQLSHQYKISIVVPVYNAAKYLARCLDSLINQTLKNIEIICVNDGSDDNSIDILNAYAARDERIKIISFEKMGPGGCRNAGIDAARGEYICFVDADDFVDLETYEKTYEKIKNADADILSFNALEIGKNGIKNVTYFGAYGEKEITWCDLGQQLFGSPFHSWHMLFKRTFLLSKAAYFADTYWCEDVPFVLLSLLQAEKIVLIPNCFYHYCRNENSLVCSGGNNRMAALRIVSQLQYVMAQNKNMHDYMESFGTWVCMHCYYAYIALSDDNRHIFCKELQKIVSRKIFNRFKKMCEKENIVKIFGLPLVKIMRFDNVCRVLFCGLPIVSIRRRK